MDKVERINRNHLRWLTVIGLLGVTGAIVAMYRQAGGFGLPGSLAYQRYEAFNRTMAIFLGMQAIGIIAFIRLGISNHGISRLQGYALIFAWLGMSIGTAAEFWLFSDLPYGQANMRSLAFSLFSFSDLLAGLLLLWIGGNSLWRHKRLPTWLAISMILYLPVDILLFLVGGIIFMAPTIFILILCTNSFYHLKTST